MKKILSCVPYYLVAGLLLSVAFQAAVGRAAGPSQVYVSGSSALAKPLAVPNAIFAYWSGFQLPDGPDSSKGLPHPDGSAVLIAPGWLLATRSGLIEVEDGELPDPTVYVFDGEWHKGEFVDYDSARNLGLIRAAVTGKPVKLPAVGKDKPPAFIAGVVWPRDSELRVEAARIGPDCLDPGVSPEDAMLIRKILPVLHRRMDFVHCRLQTVRFIEGAVMLDSAGDLVSIETGDPYSPIQLGPSADGIRSFPDLYFASWGRMVRPKPVY